MLSLQPLQGDQKPPLLEIVVSPAPDIDLGGLLGNGTIQSISRSITMRPLLIEGIEPPPSHRRRPAPVPAPSRLEALKRQRFTREGKAERVARSLSALNQRAPTRLTPEEWRWVAEDPDIEEQFT